MILKVMLLLAISVAAALRLHARWKEMVSVTKSYRDQVLNLSTGHSLKGFTLEVFSDMGKRMVSEKVEHNSHQVDFSAMQSGDYLVRLHKASVCYEYVYVKE